MAERTCHNCVYSRCDPCAWLRAMATGEVIVPRCANHPWWPGRLHDVPGVPCRNYRPRAPEPKDDEVRCIPLGDGFYAYVDAADYERLSQWTWRLCGKYAGRMEKGKLIFMHREIVQAPEGRVVDHKNRNKLDNTRDNLRPFTHAENARNRSKPRGTTSQFRGVSHDKKADKYQAQIHYHGRGHYIGYFTDEIEAARAHDTKAVQLFGEAAQVNFPKEWPPERRAEVYATPEAQSARRKAAQRRTRDAKHKTKSPRATASKEPRAKTQGRRETDQSKKVRRSEGKKTTAPKKKPRAETPRRRGQKRQTKSNRTTAPTEAKRKTHDAKRATKSKRATGRKPRPGTPKGRKARRQR